MHCLYILFVGFHFIIRIKKVKIWRLLRQDEPEQRGIRVLKIIRGCWMSVCR